MSLSRLGPDMFEATLRSGTMWRGDAQLLKTLPQGEAKLATLQMRERVAQAKVKAKAKTDEETFREEPKYEMPFAKRPRTLRISLDDVISKFEAMDGIAEDAEKILAAAITLRDNSGRDRKEALRSMAATWNVARQDKVNDKWKIVPSQRWQMTWKQHCATPL